MGNSDSDLSPHKMASWLRFLTYPFELLVFALQEHIWPAVMLGSMAVGLVGLTIDDYQSIDRLFRWSIGLGVILTVIISLAPREWEEHSPLAYLGLWLVGILMVPIALVVTAAGLALVTTVIFVAIFAVPFAIVMTTALLPPWGSFIRRWDPDYQAYMLGQATIALTIVQFALIDLFSKRSRVDSNSLTRTSQELSARSNGRWSVRIKSAVRWTAVPIKSVHGVLSRTWRMFGGPRLTLVLWRHVRSALTPPFPPFAPLAGAVAGGLALIPWIMATYYFPAIYIQLINGPSAVRAVVLGIVNGGLLGLLSWFAAAFSGAWVDSC